ncbi:hypothetical protein [Streptomyces sp. NPDC017941]|uniref:hypothetical protein n=1 Tax=Streptomyces sp. NPDC017941 TaxID=3365018 RepID=UPI0037B4EB3B
MAELPDDTAATDATAETDAVDATADGYCPPGPPGPPVPPPVAGGPPFAECVLCRKPTEYPESYRGVTLCPVCEWQEAERSACSG